MGLLTVFNRALVCIHKSRGSVPDTAAVLSALPSMSEGAEWMQNLLPPSPGCIRKSRVCSYPTFAITECTFTVSEFFSMS